MYTERQTCRFCGGSKLYPFVQFGDVPLAGGFLRSTIEFVTEKLYPLSICVCEDCFLVQVKEVLLTSELFQDYFYRSSAIPALVSHFQKYAMQLKTLLPKKSFVVELGSNDGVFLRPLAKNGYTVLGVDPAKNIVNAVDQNETPTQCAAFSSTVAQQIVKEHGQANAILTSNSFAHIDDMHEIMRGIVLLLKKDGMVGIETQYLPLILEQTQYDTFYHEHMSYYSLYSLQRFFDHYDMHIFDAEIIPMHGGSLRYFAQFNGSGTRARTSRLHALVQLEKDAGIGNVNTYQNFEHRMKVLKQTLLDQMAKYKSEGKRIVGYGASGKATQIMAYCGLTENDLEYVVDDAPAKIDCYTPGNHIPIKSRAYFEQNRPQVCVILAWTFAKEIMAQNNVFAKKGGEFLLPLPEVKVIST